MKTIVDKKAAAKEKKRQKALEHRDMHKIGNEMFSEQPVWQTAEFDAEFLRRWEQFKGEALEFGKTASGRGRIANLGDWVKAYLTMSGNTVTVKFQGLEYRCHTGVWGIVGGSRITRTDDFISVLEDLAEQVNRNTGWEQ